MISKLIQSVGTISRRLLIPQTSVAAQQERGFKVKKYVKLRCDYCYFVRVNGRLHVECNKHPKHKQREEIDHKAMW